MEVRTEYSVSRENGAQTRLFFHGFIYNQNIMVQDADKIADEFVRIVKEYFAVQNSSFGQ